MRFWLSGAIQTKVAGVTDRAHEGLYGEGRLDLLDTTDGCSMPLLRWQSPGAPRGAGMALKSASVRPGGLWLVSEREALAWSVGRGVERVISEPGFGDLHHALEHDGALWLAASAVDGVFRWTPDVPATFFPVVQGVVAPVGDVRLAPRRRRRAHPNHLLVRDGRVWVTRLHQRDVVDVIDPSRSVPIGRERIHDGVFAAGAWWFTEVDGHVLEVEPQGWTVRRRYAVAADRGGPAGWCRGVWADAESFYVGFSRLRATRFRSHLAWARRAVTGQGGATGWPTRIERFRRADGARTGVWELALDVVFTILPADPSPAG